MEGVNHQRSGISHALVGIPSDNGYPKVTQGLLSLVKVAIVSPNISVATPNFNTSMMRFRDILHSLSTRRRLER